jgi:hypothetical protein
MKELPSIIGIKNTYEIIFCSTENKTVMLHHRIYFSIESSYLPLYLYSLHISLRRYHISNYARKAYRESFANRTKMK